MSFPEATVATPAGLNARFSELPPVVLTFLAPADRCNQRCPACIIDRMGEPVSEFVLSPEDFAAVVSDFLRQQIPILGINFQGYEVTLPRSWPYVESVFALAQRHDVRRTFITNGMLLDRWTGRIVELEPHRIAVSLDGADAEANDAKRGLQGAFHATTRSLERFLSKAPSFAPRLAVASTLFDEANFRSLLAMPRLLRRLGVPKWALTAEGDFFDGRQEPVRLPKTVGRWLRKLREAAEGENITFQFNDEFGFFKNRGGSLGEGKSLFNPDFIVRVDPTGHMRVGRELLTCWTPDPARRWVPGRSAVDVIGYWELAAQPRPTPG